MSCDENFHNSAASFNALVLSVCLTFMVLPVGTALFTSASLLSLAIWLFSGVGVGDRKNWQDQLWVVPLAALVLLPWIGMLWSGASTVQSLDLAKRSHYWLFALVAFTSLKSPDWLRRSMISFIAGTTVISLIVMLYLAGIIPETTYLQKFQFYYYITFSLFQVIAILLLAYFYRCSDWPRNLLIGGLMLFLAVSITCLKGRSAYLALLMLSPWMFTVMFRRCNMLLPLGAVVLTVGLMASSGTVRTRLALIPKEIALFKSGTSLTYQLPDGTVTPSSIGLRIRMWKNAVNIFMDHPLIGAGTAGYKHETDKRDPSLTLTHPHNSYLYVAASYGIMGIALYGWVLYITLKRGWSSRQSLSGHSILAFVLVVLIGSLTDTQIITAATGVALGFVIGIPTTVDSPCVS